MWFKKKTDAEKLIDLKCDVASLEKEVEVMWKIERTGGYVFGKRDEIIECESAIAGKKKRIKLMEANGSEVSFEGEKHD